MANLVLMSKLELLLIRLSNGCVMIVSSVLNAAVVQRLQKFLPSRSLILNAMSVLFLSAAAVIACS